MSFLLLSTWFLNLPLWANFYNYTDLSHSTTTFRPTNPIGWPQPQPSTRLAQQHRLRRVEAKVEARVEAGWGKLRPSQLSWILLDDLNSGLRQVEGCSSVRFWPSQWTHHCIAIHDSTARLRQAYKAEFQLYFDLHRENITEYQFMILYEGKFDRSFWSCFLNR